MLMFYHLAICFCCLTNGEASLSDLSSSNMQVGSSQALEGCCSCQYTIASCVGSLLQEAKHKLRDFKAQGIANTSWALRILSYQDVAVMLSMADLHAQVICNTLHGHAVIGYFLQLGCGSLAGHPSHAFVAQSSHSVTNHEILQRQAFQYMMILEAQGFLARETETRSDAYQQFRKLCKEDWTSNMQASPSRTQLEMFLDNAAAPWLLRSHV
jgi:hypothetical protein